MRCLWCFRIKLVRRRSRNNRNDHTQESLASPGSVSLEAQSSHATQSVSRPNPQTPPQQQARATFDTPYTTLSLSSGSPPSVIRTPHTEHLFTPTAAPRQYRTTNDFYGPYNSLRSHESRMVRLQTRQKGPRSCEDSPTLLGNWKPGGMTFKERMTRLSNRSTSASGHPTQRETFLDDSSTSSENEDDTGSCNLHDSGYISSFPTPARLHRVPVNATSGPLILPDLVPAPLFFEGRLAESSARSEEPHTSRMRNSMPLCDHRSCLRHKRSCLEHTPTPALKSRRDETSRRTRGRREEQHEPDVWMQLAAEFGPGV
ncbi:hypothetical protein M3J09_004146 [Ascochyta lentis]